MQDVLAEFDLPRAVLATIENVNPSECIASLGALVKVLSPDRSKNELFAQQYIAVRPCPCKPPRQVIATTLQHP